jgi:uridylate kinase
MARYKRVLIKLSGESLAGESRQGIDPSMLEKYTTELKRIVQEGIQVAVVLGGGNIFRGIQGTGKGVDRVQGDYMGMLATIINGMALENALNNSNIEAVLLSGLPVEPVCQKMKGSLAIQHLEEGRVVIIAGGTGNPFFTTDSAAALRALEIKADALLKGTRVDGIYTADPEKYPDAKKLDQITFEDAYQKNLGVMDMTAFTLCKENNLPIIVFDINKPGILFDMLVADKIEGTIVSN